MWGSKKKAPGGYTDNIYRSRSTRGFESTSRCCCFYFTRSVLLGLVLTFLLGAGALSVLAVVFGYSQRWTYNVNRGITPAYSIRTGWLYFSDNRMSPGARTSLKELGQATYILGIVGLVMNCISALLAAICCIRALCGRIGRGFICLSIPFSILLIGSQVAYYIVTAFQVYKYAQRKVNGSKVPWPDWAWGMAAGAAACWLAAAGSASVLPRRHKYQDAEADFSRPAPAVDPYQSPARGTPVQQGSPYSQQQSAQGGYTPSSVEPTLTNGATPLAAQENPGTDYGESKKKSFLPSWSKKARGDQGVPASTSGGGGSYRTRAEEIASRYKGRDAVGETELGGYPSAPPAPPKSAW